MLLMTSFITLRLENVPGSPGMQDGGYNQEDCSHVKVDLYTEQGLTSTGNPSSPLPGNGIQLGCRPERWDFQKGQKIRHGPAFI